MIFSLCSMRVNRMSRQGNNSNKWVTSYPCYLQVRVTTVTTPYRVLLCYLEKVLPKAISAQEQKPCSLSHFQLIRKA